MSEPHQVSKPLNALEAYRLLQQLQEEVPRLRKELTAAERERDALQEELAAARQRAAALQDELTLLRALKDSLRLLNEEDSK